MKKLNSIELNRIKTIKDAFKTSPKFIGGLFIDEYQGNRLEFRRVECGLLNNYYVLVNNIKEFNLLIKKDGLSGRLLEVDQSNDIRIILDAFILSKQLTKNEGVVNKRIKI